MVKLNYVLFEEFKCLDKLCGELYGDQRGISHYIDDMKNAAGGDYKYIPNWKEDLEQLVRIRHIRNYLAHTEGAFNEEVCTQNDIEWCQDFHRRILNQSDPLAMLYQYSKAKQQVIREKRPIPQFQVPQLSVQYNIVNKRVRKIGVKQNKEMNSFFWIVLLLTMVGILLLAIFSIIAVFE